MVLIKLIHILIKYLLLIFLSSFDYWSLKLAHKKFPSLFCLNRIQVLQDRLVYFHWKTQNGYQIVQNLALQNLFNFFSCRRCLLMTFAFFLSSAVPSCFLAFLCPRSFSFERNLFFLLRLLPYLLQASRLPLCHNPSFDRTRFSSPLVIFD